MHMVTNFFFCFVFFSRCSFFVRIGRSLLLLVFFKLNKQEERQNSKPISSAHKLSVQGMFSIPRAQAKRMMHSMQLSLCEKCIPPLEAGKTTPFALFNVNGAQLIYILTSLPQSGCLLNVARQWHKFVSFRGAAIAASISRVSTQFSKMPSFSARVFHRPKQYLSYPAM